MNNSIKHRIINTIGYNLTNKLKKLLGKSSFSEIDAIFEFALDQNMPKMMIDVGSHFGESSIYFLQEGWNVVGFEPDPQNRKEILGHKNMAIHNYAISDHIDEGVDFFTSKESSGISSLLNFSESHESSYKVDIKTLDVIIEEMDITDVGFLKIDTEGYDLNVLKGLTFDKIKPRIVLCEFEDNKTLKLDYSYKDMGDFLISQGYIVYLSEWWPITKYGSNHSWKKIQKYPVSIDDNAWGNFIAIVPEYENEFEKAMTSYQKKF